MIKIDRSPETLSGFRSQLSDGQALPEDTETFAIAGTRTRISHAQDQLSAEAQVQVSFRPADPSVQLPERVGRFSEAERDNILCLLASPDARFGSLRINAPVRIYTCKLGAGHQITFHPRPAHHLRIILISGQLDVLGEVIATGDVASLSDEEKLILSALSDSDFLMLELS